MVIDGVNIPMAMLRTYYWMILYSLPSWIQIIIAQKRKDTNCQKIPDRFQTINRNDECGTSAPSKKIRSEAEEEEGWNATLLGVPMDSIREDCVSRMAPRLSSAASKN
jgi:hypothetical protein